MENYISIHQSANQKRRRFVAFCLVFASALFAIYLIRSDSKETRSGKLLLPEKTDNSLSSLVQESPSPFVPQKNVTNEIVQKYGEEVRRLNADKAGKTAVTPSEIITPPEGFLERLLSEDVVEKTLPMQLFVPADVPVVSSTPDKDAAYLKQLGMLFAQVSLPSLPYFSAAEEALLQSSPAPLRAHVRVAQGQLASLLALQVPERALSLHLELLNMWKRRGIIGEALLREDDPLGRLLAVNSLSDVFAREEQLMLFLRALPSTF